MPGRARFPSGRSEPPREQMANPTSIAVLPQSELETLIRRAVAEALADASAGPAPALLDRAGLARSLCCCESTVDTLRRNGLPTIFVGKAPRFVLADVLHWLKEESATDDD